MADIPYTIGLYERQDDIPEGMWGYIIDSDHPAGFVGSYYNRTAAENDVWCELEEAEKADLLKDTAPLTVEQLLVIADADAKKPSIIDERRRIIGSTIATIRISNGLRAKIEDLYLSPGDSGPLITFILSSVIFFKPGYERLRLLSDSWSFDPDRITSLKASAGGNGGRLRCSAKD